MKKLVLAGMVILGLMCSNNLYAVSREAIKTSVEWRIAAMKYRFRVVEPLGLTFVKYLQGMLKLVDVTLALDKVDRGNNVYTVYVDPTPVAKKYGVTSEKLNGFIRGAATNPRNVGEDRIRRAVEEFLRSGPFQNNLWQDIQAVLDNEIKPTLIVPLTKLYGVGEEEFREEGSIYADILEPLVNLVKKGEDVDDLVWEIESFKIPLKEKVAEYYKHFTGQDFDILDLRQAEELSFWSEYAVSLAMRPDRAGYIREEVPNISAVLDIISSYLQTRMDLKQTVEDMLGYGNIDVLDSMENSILHYLADLTLPPEKGGKGLSMEDVNALAGKIKEKLADTRHDVENALLELGYLQESNNRIVGRFTAMVLDRLLSDWTIQAYFLFLRNIYDMSEKVAQFFAPLNVAQQEYVRNSYINTRKVSGNTPDEIVNGLFGEDYKKALDWVVNRDTGFIRALVDVKGIFEELKGSEIDVTNPEHEAILMQYASTVKFFMDTPVKDSYSIALGKVRDMIKELPDPFAQGAELAVSDDFYLPQEGDTEGVEVAPPVVNASMDFLGLLN